MKHIALAIALMSAAACGDTIENHYVTKGDAPSETEVGSGDDAPHADDQDDGNPEGPAGDGVPDVTPADPIEPDPAPADAGTIDQGDEPDAGDADGGVADPAPEDDAGTPDPEPEPDPSCGDGTCDPGETHATCPQDCAAPPPVPADDLVTVAFTQVATSLDAGTKNAHLADLTVTSATDVQFQRTDLTFYFLRPKYCEYVDNLRVVDGTSGTTVFGPIDLKRSTTGYDCDGTGPGLVEFTKVWELLAGKSKKFKIIADVSANVPNGEFYVAFGDGWDIFDEEAVFNVTTGEYLSVDTDFDPFYPIWTDAFVTANVACGDMACSVHEDAVSCPEDCFAKEAAPAVPATCSNVSPFRGESHTVNGAAVWTMEFDNKNWAKTATVANVRFCGESNVYGYWTCTQAGDQDADGNADLVIKGADMGREFIRWTVTIGGAWFQLNDCVPYISNGRDFLYKHTDGTYNARIDTRLNTVRPAGNLDPLPPQSERVVKVLLDKHEVMDPALTLQACDLAAETNGFDRCELVQPGTPHHLVMDANVEECSFILGAAYHNFVLIELWVDCFSVYGLKDDGTPDPWYYMNVVTHEALHQMGIWFHVPETCSEYEPEMCGDAIMNPYASGPYQHLQPGDYEAWDRRYKDRSILPDTWDTDAQNADGAHDVHEDCRIPVH